MLLTCLQDYQHSYYPITLPLRRPDSGNPGISQVYYSEDGYKSTNTISKELSSTHFMILKQDCFCLSSRNSVGLQGNLDGPINKSFCEKEH